MRQSKMLLRLQFKRAIKNFPQLLICSLVIAAFVAVVVIFSVASQNQKSPIKKKRVAMVIGEGNSIINTVGMNAFENMDSAAALFEIMKLDEEEALERFDAGELDGVIVFPDGYVEGITRGENLPATLYVNNAGKTYSMDLFATAADIANDFLAVNEAVSYAMRDMFDEFGYKDSGNTMSNNLDIITTRTVLSRDASFKKTTIVGEDESSMVVDYACGALVMLVLLWGLSCGSIIKSDGAVMTRKLKAGGISVLKQELIRFASLFFILELMMLLVVAILFAGVCIKGESFEILGIYDVDQVLFLIPAFIIPVMFASAMVMFCFTVAPNEIGGLLLLFTLMLLGGYCSGCIVALVYLASAVRSIAGYLPMGQMREVAKSAIVCTWDFKNTLILAVWTVVLFTLCVVINGKRGASE
ncbi:MAG: ABC transporter permease [Lachnospiraceae bacterium]|nr:ABC transporter permease [Lachnospiraceae bacterium]